jgi:hypothetical protein
MDRDGHRHCKKEYMKTGFPGLTRPLQMCTITTLVALCRLISIQKSRLTAPFLPKRSAST